MTNRPNAEIGLILLMTALWALMAAIVVFLPGRLPRASPPAALQWGVLVTTSLVLPLWWMVRLRRRTAYLRSSYANLPDAVIEELHRAGWSFLALGYISAVSAIGLLLYYA
jgi:hypothetical protein